MPHLSADYVYRFLRVSAACREAFDRRLVATAVNEETDHSPGFAWRHADLFMAGFPRVGLKPGYDMLCFFTLVSSDRSSGLLGYKKDGPEMVRDLIDADFQESYDGDEDKPFVGTARQDEQVLLVPKMPPNWAQQEGECPSWLRPDPNDVLTDDGTIEGVFERAQLLIWSSEPVNQWHAVGFGHHAIQLNTPTPDESFKPVDAEGNRLERGDATNRVALPDVWLPQVELGLSDSNLGWAALPAEKAAAFRGKTLNVVRFYTYSEHVFRAYHEFTVWITEDVWHLDQRAVLMGEGGFIC
jgi:hypothetical protein